MLRARATKGCRCAFLIGTLVGCTVSGSSTPSPVELPPIDQRAPDPRAPASMPPPIQAPVRTSREVRVAAGAPAVIGESGLEIVMRKTHDSYQPATAATAEEGMPYAKVGDAWLEIAGTTTVISGGKVYRLKVTGCATESRSGDDYFYDAITSCAVLADELDVAAAPMPTSGFVQRVTIADRYAATGGTAVGERGFVAVRSTGFYIGNRLPPGFVVVESILAGIDVVTPFGVKNIDFTYETKPIIGHEETFEIGPQKVTLKVLDVGNINTKCDPGCRNVFDFEVRTEPLPGAPAEAAATILEYR